MRGQTRMLIAKDDEAKRSKIWRIATLVSSVLIVVVAVFLLTKLFTSNPLEGKWESEDGSFVLNVNSGDTLVVELTDVTEDGNVSVKLPYSIDKDAKMVAIKEDEELLENLADKSDGAYTAETLESALAGIVTTFDYSVDQDQLTLTEREYGEQLTFIKK